MTALEEAPEPLVRVRTLANQGDWVQMQEQLPWKRLGTYSDIAASNPDVSPDSPGYVAEMIALRAYADLLLRHRSGLTAEAILVLEHAAASAAYPKAWRYILQLRLAQMTRCAIGFAESMPQFDAALQWAGAFGHPLDLAAGQMVYGGSIGHQSPDDARKLLNAARETMQSLQGRITTQRLVIDAHIRLIHLWLAAMARAEGRTIKARWHYESIGNVTDDLLPVHVSDPLAHPSFYRETFFDW